MNSDNYYLDGLGSNLVDNFVLIPDSCLEALQKLSQYTLSPEQYKIAKLSGMEMAKYMGLSLTILDFVTIWEDSPTLSIFANKLRQSCLPE
ncbi:hypothetical protein [cf. Phormidesmis sp. LEGE 11477]|uniref:hypothetical protein n=1 Tax=cf. Phormidesmis sp. LEGE 11477 TaxID=1828680 RepID=UPI001880EBE1|nr:hypothetical protein [cf. Phormidesmis sp. LEGE 11477]MBE9064045.1 hypothetical protein [cf. Phormidesmis sp. LEGE 11477]